MSKPYGMTYHIIKAVRTISKRGNSTRLEVEEQDHNIAGGETRNTSYSLDDAELQALIDNLKTLLL